jgi:hypothetical protein
MDAGSSLTSSRWITRLKEAMTLNVVHEARSIITKLSQFEQVFAQCRRALEIQVNDNITAQIRLEQDGHGYSLWAVEHSVFGNVE